MIHMLHLIGEFINTITGQRESAPDITNCRSWSICDHRACHAGAIASVTIKQILQYFFAAFVLEINVDIRCFIAFATDESFEQHIDAAGIN